MLVHLIAKGRSMRQVLYKTNDFMGCSVEKGDIIGVDVIAEDKDSGVILVLARGAGRDECPCMFLVKPQPKENYYVNIGGEDAYLNINKKLSRKFLSLAK